MGWEVFSIFEATAVYKKKLHCRKSFSGALILNVKILPAYLPLNFISAEIKADSKNLY